MKNFAVSITRINSKLKPEIEFVSAQNIIEAETKGVDKYTNNDADDTDNIFCMRDMGEIIIFAKEIIL